MASSPAAAAGGAFRGDQPPGRRSPLGPGGAAALPRNIRSVSGFVSVAGAGVIWIALLGPVIALLTHLSGSAIAGALTAPGALDPVVVSLAAGGVTLAVLLLLGTPLAWMLARGTLPFPRVWEAGVLCSLLLPPLVIGLLLIFLIGPFTPIGQLLGALHLSATNTFLALVIAEVYEWRWPWPGPAPWERSAPWSSWPTIRTASRCRSGRHCRRPGWPQRCRSPCSCW